MRKDNEPQSAEVCNNKFHMAERELLFLGKSLNTFLEFVTGCNYQ